METTFEPKQSFDIFYETLAFTTRLQQIRQKLFNIRVSLRSET